MAEHETPEPESVKLFEGMSGSDSGNIPTYDVTIRVRRSTPKYRIKHTGMTSI